MKKLAIVGAGRMACIFAKNAKEMGIETHCFAWSEGAIAKDKVDFFYPISIFEKEKILKICEDVGVGAAVATTELTIAVVAYITEKMGLNGNSIDIGNVITDKYRNRNVTRNVNRLCQPLFSVVKTEEEIRQLKFQYPVILKPTDKGGKRGISVIYSEDDIHEAFEYAKAESQSSTELIVEEFIDGGQEYSVESLSYHGKNYIIQITEKVSSGAPHCVELGHHQPGNLSAEKREQVMQVLDEALTKIGIVNGPCHTEIKMKDDKIYLIEFNARPGGDHIAYPLTELSTGYPYIKGIISVAFDECDQIRVKDFEQNCTGVLFVTEQTKELKPLFDVCQKYEWCYKKNEVSTELTSLFHNDGYNTNFFIYLSKNGRPNFEKILNSLS